MSTSTSGPPEDTEYKLSDLPKWVKGCYVNNDGGNPLKSVKQIRGLSALFNDPPLDKIIQSGVIPQIIKLTNGQYDLICSGYIRELSLLLTQIVPIDIIKICIMNCINDELQNECLWIILNVSSGTDKQTKYIIDCGAIPILCESFELSNSFKVKDSCFWALGNISGTNQNDSEHVDSILSQGILSKLRKCISNMDLYRIEHGNGNGNENHSTASSEHDEHSSSDNDTTEMKMVTAMAIDPETGNGAVTSNGNNDEMDFLRTASWTIFNICRLLPDATFNKYSQIMIKVLTIFLSMNDKEVLQNATWACFHFVNKYRAHVVMHNNNNGNGDRISEFMKCEVFQRLCDLLEVTDKGLGIALARIFGPLLHEIPGADSQYDHSDHYEGNMRQWVMERFLVQLDRALQGTIQLRELYMMIKTMVIKDIGMVKVFMEKGIWERMTDIVRENSDIAIPVALNVIGYVISIDKCTMVQYFAEEMELIRIILLNYEDINERGIEELNNMDLLEQQEINHGLEIIKLCIEYDEGLIKCLHDDKNALVAFITLSSLKRIDQEIIYKIGVILHIYNNSELI